MKIIGFAFWICLLSTGYGIPASTMDSLMLYAAPHSIGVGDNSEGAQYEFQYAVHDSHTGDVKDQFEHRRGGYVTGRYSLLDADGLQRVVEYSSDPLLGFTAEVRREMPKITIVPIDHEHVGTGATATGPPADEELVDKLSH